MTDDTTDGDAAQAGPPMTGDPNQGQAAQAVPPPPADPGQSGAAPVDLPRPIAAGDRYNGVEPLSYVRPGKFFIVVVWGMLKIDNPGIRPVLRTALDRQPWPANTLLLDLELVQKPGDWPRAGIWFPIEYGVVLGLNPAETSPIPTQVTIANGQIGDATFELIPF